MEKLAASGVCHSDWHLATGDTKHPMPVVAGHEPYLDWLAESIGGEEAGT